MARRLTLLLCLLAVAALIAGAATAQMKEPKKVTVSGTLVDMSCAAKAKGMMNSWANTKNDHMMPDGNVQKDCAQMCLNTGQPAAVFNGSKISAVLACSGKHTLVGFAGESIDIEGFWATDGIFVPEKIRKSGGSWSDVQCAEMHG
ncbi:MAG TPA: hypothetical protein VMV46_19585 [Thermoanaerobaculia bacterium]|nr:hypothetical protein [Thermoanaerobaculia bacterium]